MNTRFLLTACCLCAAFLLAPHSLLAADSGTITIEQESPNGIVGEWLLIKPDNKQLTLKRDEYTLEEADLGTYTLRIEPPAGAETKVMVFIDLDLLETKDQPQASFTLEANMNYRIRIVYNFTRTGKIGVNSVPPGVDFLLTGPNDLAYEGTTPADLDEMPEGQYAVEYEEIPNCPKAAKLSDKLIVDGRVNFDITFECDGIADMDGQQDFDRSLQFVTATVEGASVTFEDLPISAWYAPFANTAIRTGIMSGYRDRSGKISGSFGPSDQVNLAQLAKIAHELANIDENNTTIPVKNQRAKNQWFERYFASAEWLQWQVFTDARVDPGRPATRAEVVATLVQALQIPRFWATGDLFTDVRRNTPYAHSIETASRDGVVSGFTDANGDPTGKFGPDQPVNRAEMAKIIGTAIEIYVEGR